MIARSDKGLASMFRHRPHSLLERGAEIRATRLVTASNLLTD